MSDFVADAQELRVAIGRVARRLRKVYTPDDDPGPGFTELAVLVRLNRDGATSPTELAGREGVTSQAIAAAVRALEAKGLVSRSPDPDDGRRTVLAMTDAGLAVLRDREKTLMNGFVQALGDSFTEAERRRLYAVIPLLNRLADTI